MDSSRSIPAVKRAGAIAFGLALFGVGAGLLLGACTGERPSAAVDAPNCMENESRACAVELASHDGVLECARGTKTCSGGRWSACIASGDDTYSVPAPPASAATPSGSTLTTKDVTYTYDGGASGNCSSDPCDPYCNGFTDTPPDGGFTSEAGSTTTSVSGTFVLMSEIPTGAIPGGFFTAGMNAAACASTDTKTKQKACQFDMHCASGSTCVATDPLVGGITTVGGTTYCCRAYAAGEKGSSSCTGIDVTIPPLCTPAGGTARSLDVCNRGNAPLSQDVKCWIDNSGSSAFPPDTIDLTVPPAVNTVNATTSAPTANKPQGKSLAANPLLPGECRQFLIADGDLGSGRTNLVCNPYQTSGATVVSAPECNIWNNWSITKASPGIPCGSYPILTTTFSATPWSVSRVFQATCPTGSIVAWKRFGYASSTPGGTSIDFRFHAFASVKNSSGVAVCPAATPETTSTPLARAASTPTDTQTCSLTSAPTGTCPVSLASMPSLDCLEMDANGNVAVTTTSALSPTLTSWQTVYDCIYGE